MVKIDILYKDISSKFEPTRAYKIINKYYVDQKGNIYSKRNKSFKKLCLFQKKDGYLTIKLHCKNSKGKNLYKNFRINQIVAQIYKPNGMKKGLQVDHINGNRQDNSINNLKWVTCRYNNSIKDFRKQTKGMKQLFEVAL